MNCCMHLDEKNSVLYLYQLTKKSNIWAIQCEQLQVLYFAVLGYLKRHGSVQFRITQRESTHAYGEWQEDFTALLGELSIANNSSNIFYHAQGQVVPDTMTIRYMETPRVTAL